MRSKSVTLMLLLVAAALISCVPAMAQIASESWTRIGLAYSGNITAIATSPSYDADETVYIGVSGKGLWVSNDRGLTWAKCPAIPGESTVVDIALAGDYHFGSSKAAFAVTREGHCYRSDSDFATLYSEDPYGVFDCTFTDRAGGPVACSAVEMEGLTTWSGVVYVGTPGGGVFRSATNGAPFSWGRINENTAMDDCKALALNSAPTQELFAACNAGTAGPIFKWTGSGQTWIPLGPTGLANVEPMSLHSDRGNYSLMWVGTKTRGMWYSQNDGQAWDKACDGSYDTDQTFQVRAIASCPKFSSDHELWEGRSDGMRKSTNGGTSCAGTQPYSPVTTIAFTPSYHAATGLCDAFIGTEIGLYMYSGCGSAPQATGPVVVDGQAVALANHGSGIFMGSASRGLFKCVDYHNMIQYNSFPNKQVPNITAICLDPIYNENGTCGTDATTLFVAANFPSSPNSNGVYKSTDGGNFWVRQDLGWPSGTVILNDLAISPQYREAGPDYTLFAATDRGLLRWDGPTSGWLWVLPEVPVNRVAVPPTYDRSNGGGTPTGFPYHAVFIARWNIPEETWYSFNNGDSFNFMGGECPGTNCLQKVTGFAFPSNFGVGANPSRRIFISSSTLGVKYGVGPYPWTYWNPANSSLPSSLDARDIAADPDWVDSVPPIDPILLCAIATPSSGFSDFGLYRTADAGVSWNPKAIGSAISVTFEIASASSETMSLTGFKPESTTGGSYDGGAHFSEDDPVYVPLGSYRSLPDDVQMTVPHWRDPDIVFAASPSMGIFVSEDKGESFRPWNRGKGGTEGPCRLTDGYGISMLSDRRGTNLDVVWAGTESTGIKAMYTYYNTSQGTVDLDHESVGTENGWRDCTIDGGTMGGKWEKIEVLPGTAQTFKVWASSTTSGWASLADGAHWLDWASQGSFPNSTSVRHAYDGPQAITSGVGQSGSVAQGSFNYYSIQVPSGSKTLSVAMHPTAGDPDLYIKYGTLPNEPDPWDYRPYYSGLVDEQVCVGSYLINEDFSEGIPLSWTIVDGGVGGGGASTWTAANPGARIITSPFSTPFAIVDSDNASGSATQDEQLITPSFSTIGAKTVILEFSNQFNYYSGGMSEIADVDVSIDGGTVWSNVFRMQNASDGYPAPNTKVIDISSYVSNCSNVKIRFHYYNGNYEWYWAIDNVKVRTSAVPILSGKWYLGVRGYAAGISSYSLTATVDGCTAGFATAATADPARALKAPIRFSERIPGPDGPSASIIWGTVSGTGVKQGTQSTFMTPDPEATTWTDCNGVNGPSPLANKNTNTVIQLPDLTLIAGCNGDVFWSPDGPCDTRPWYSSTAYVASHGSNNFQDLLMASNGDVLIAASGTGDGTSTGGVWLSGDNGGHWMKISSGFDATTQKLTDLIVDSGTPPSYYSSTTESGLFTRTITASPYPVVTGVSPNNCGISGGTTVIIAGTGFSGSCPTELSSDCPDSAPVVFFGTTPVTGTFLSDTQITAVAPANSAGSVVIDVRNPDTRRSYSTIPLFTYTCDLPSGMSNNAAADADPCSDSGVQITWSDPTVWGDGGDTSRTFDILRDGSAIASGLSSGTHSYTDITGVNATVYTYSVMAINSCGLPVATSGVTASDNIASTPAVNVTPDGTMSACTGTGIVFTASAVGGTAPYSYQWTENGSDISGATNSTYTANKSSQSAFTYNCKVSSSGCSTQVQDAAASTGDWVEPPTFVDVAPDGSSTVQAGMAVTWFVSAVIGGTPPYSYQWSEDGIDIPGAINSSLNRTYETAQTHTYNCKVNSSGCSTQVQDAAAVTGVWQQDPPPECARGDSESTAQRWSGTSTHWWPPADRATGYRLYRGQRNDLTALLGPGGDSCTRYDGTGTSVSGVSEDPSELPAGDFYWYLVTAYNTSGEGSAGDATAGARTINSSGNCP